MPLFTGCCRARARRALPFHPGCRRFRAVCVVLVSGVALWKAWLKFVPLTLRSQFLFHLHSRRQLFRQLRLRPSLCSIYHLQNASARVTDSVSLLQAPCKRWQLSSPCFVFLDEMNNDRSHTRPALFTNSSFSIGLILLRTQR
ncbi:unnamed protein product [Amoebophrya sp. A120]|nr:unnamed protein product [Amoebophrya sp. A120]|eukprot:GSA120T00022103001.1